MAVKTDNQLYQIILPIINNGLVADGFKNVLVKQANQPTQQGVPNSPTVFITKLADKRYGFLGRLNVYDEIASTITHTETQYYETTYRISGLVLQYPNVISNYTAADLIKEVSSIMQSDNTRDILNASGIGILRIKDIVNSYFTDDKDNFEAIPSFEFTLTYLNTRVNSVPIVNTYVVDIEGV